MEANTFSAVYSLVNRLFSGTAGAAMLTSFLFSVVKSYVTVTVPSVFGVTVAALPFTVAVAPDTKAAFSAEVSVMPAV